MGRITLRFETEGAAHGVVMERINRVLDDYLPDADWDVEIDVSTVTIRKQTGETRVAMFTASIEATLTGVPQ